MPALIQWKVINPGPIKADAIRLEVLSALHRVEREIKADFRRTTATWEHQVEFESAVGMRGGVAEVLVGTDDEIYHYVNDGTRPHMIWAGIYTGKSRARALRFHSRFRPKTRPHYITSYRGMVGGTVLFRPYVNHPGTEAREFDKTLEKRWRPRFSRLMREAVARGIAKSGHAMR